MRTRTLLTAIVAAGAAVFSGCGHSDVTRARLERSLPVVFSNVYVQQAKILGHKGITAQNLHAKAQCDKGGPSVPDHGPGADWICLMTWNDPNIPAGTLPGKFEMNVHSNDCYTAGGPSKIVGLLTITDTHGRDVDNPVFEFDGCFNPKGSNQPTGVSIQTTTSSATPPPAPPAALTLSPGTVQIDAHGRIHPALECAAGDGGCAGNLTATQNGRQVATTTYAVAAGKTGQASLRLAPGTRGAITIAIEPIVGAATTKTATLTITGS